MVGNYLLAFIVYGNQMDYGTDDLDYDIGVDSDNLL